jgi:LacI family transcriptional regulator
MKKITRKDVAQRAGVSTAVVSYVINNGPRPTSKESRERVISAIAELGYRANNVARSLTSKASRIIGLLIPDIANVFFSEVAQGVEETAFSQGYRVIFCNTHGNQDRLVEYIDTLISQMVDGVIMITTLLPEHLLFLLEQYEIPVVLVDPEKKRTEEINHAVGLVTVDGIEGGRLVAENFLKNNHREIAIITDSLDVSPSADRVDGFMQTLGKAGVKPRIALTTGDKLVDGYKATEQLLTSLTPPSAIFACNDMLAIGVIRCANDRKVQIPQSLSVIGYDDIVFADFISPRLTTIHQPKYQMGEAAANMLLKKIDSQKTGSESETGAKLSTSILMNVSLVIRETSRG